VIVRPSTAPFPPDPQEPIAVYVDLVERVASSAWAVLGSWGELADGGAVEADSKAWCERLLHAPFDPHRGAKATRTVHRATDATFDLVRFSLLAEGLAVEITESVKFVLVRIAPDAGFDAGADEAASAAAIAQLADRVLVTRGEAIDASGEAVPYAWDLLYEPPLADGTRMSSAPEADPMALPIWSARLDGGLARGVPFFLAHKLHASGDGRVIMLSGRHWFDGKCWEPYARVTR
jgi:hypothetical protein